MVQWTTLPPADWWCSIGGNSYWKCPLVQYKARNLNQNCILGDNLIKGEGIKMMKLRNHLPSLLSLNGIVLTSWSRNFFTDLIWEPVLFFIFCSKNKIWRRAFSLTCTVHLHAQTPNLTLKFPLPFSLTCSVGLQPQSPHLGGFSCTNSSFFHISQSLWKIFQTDATPF